MIYRIEKVKGSDGKNHKAVRPIANREELMALRDSKENVRTLRQFKDGNKRVKGNLLQLAYNLGYADDTLAGCKSIGSFFFHDIDCYDAEQAGKFKETILEKKDEIGLMMLERSASGGWHLVCRREKGKTILENQIRVATVLQIEMDTNAHDLQRVVFSTTGSEDDLVYLDDELFGEPMTEAECEAEYEALKEREARGEEVLPEGMKKAEKHYCPSGKGDGGCPCGQNETRGQAPRSISLPGNNSLSQSPSIVEKYPDSYHGIPFDVILQKYWELNNAGFEPTEGDRDTLTFQLASDLRHICGKNFEWLDQVIPCYDGFPLEEKRQKIKNALSSKFEGFPQRLRDVLNALEKKKSVEVKKDEVIEFETNSAQPPQMPKKLPQLIKLLTSNTPERYRAAVAHAVFPPLATHLCNVRFTYTDNVEHEATLMNCLLAGTGSGKGCIDKPIERIMADIKRRDEENEKREAEWKKDCQKKGANKDKQLRPEGLVIQIIDSDMTKPALVTRMDESEDHFIYVKLNELDLFEQLKGQTGKQHFQLMCLAFDPDSEYGQTRIGTQSVTARPKCRFNWNACSTIIKGRRFFSKVVTDGPISRINFCTIPEEEIGCEQPIFGTYDFAFDEALKPYIDNLTSARGLIECPQAFRLAKKLIQECAEFARLSQSEVYWNLSHRACVIAWLKACVLYVANGQKWESSIDEFVRWSLNYDLWCKIQFFGEDIERANNAGEPQTHPGPRNLMELLPEVFTKDDAKRLRQQQGMDTSKTQGMISSWKKRHYVVQMADGSYKKLIYINKENK